jgi:hypothetical protein
MLHGTSVALAYKIAEALERTAFAPKCGWAAIMALQYAKKKGNSADYHRCGQ